MRCSEPIQWSWVIATEHVYIGFPGPEFEPKVNHGLSPSGQDRRRLLTESGIARSVLSAPTSLADIDMSKDVI